MDVISSLPVIAERLSARACAVGLSVADLEAACPWLCHQIIRDAATPELWGLWGRSTNLDELAGVPIVEPSILSAIGELAHVSMVGPGVHAGLQHTYGYLLSTIQTPFGYKRDRWLRPWLAQGFGLPLDALVPNPTEGTLLSNATLFAGMMAFRGDKMAMHALLRIASSAATSLADISRTRFEQIRIVETLFLHDSAGRPYTLKLHSDLVPFPNPVALTAEKCLLVYSIQDSRQPSPQLTTFFPITQQFLLEMTQPDRFQRDVEIRLRFNAFVPGLTNASLTGERTLLCFDPASFRIGD